MVAVLDDIGIPRSEYELGRTKVFIKNAQVNDWRHAHPHTPPFWAHNRGHKGNVTVVAVAVVDLADRVINLSHMARRAKRR